ncbi:hypothetical protein D9M71_221280 [compost metagenome]
MPVEVGGERKVAYALVVHAHSPPLQIELALRRLQAAGEVQAAVQLAEQARPELPQPRQGDVQVPGQALVEAGFAAHPVVAEAQFQSIDLPGIALALGDGLEQRRLATQTALQVELGVEAQLAVLQFAAAAQRTAQLAGHLFQPVGGIEVAQGQRGIPGQRIGKTQLQISLGPALTGPQLQ